MRHWRTLRIGPAPWSVYLVTPEEMHARHPDHPDVRGMCLAAENRIDIDDTLPEAQRLEVVLHEFLHAVFPDDYLSPLLRRGVSSHDVEEYVVTSLARSLLPVLQDAGLFPHKLPRARKGPRT